MRCLYRVMAAAVITLGAAPDRAAAQCMYEATLILAPDIPSGGGAHGKGINEQGHVCGYYDLGLSGYSDAFISLDGQSMITLKRPPEIDGAKAEDIADVGGLSDQGLIVGTANLNQRGFRAFRHDGNAFVVLPPLTNGLAFTFGEGADNQVRVVGASQDLDNQVIDAVVWDQAMPTDMPTTMPPYGWAIDASSDGLVVGWMGQAPWAGEAHAFMYDLTAMVFTDIGKPQGSMSVQPYAINDAGEFTGVVYWTVPDHDTPPPSAFLYSDGEWIFPEDDPDLPDEISPRDINSNRQIVGIYLDNDGVGFAEAFLWQDGELLILNDLFDLGEVMMTSASAINDAGQIVGYGGEIGGDAGALVLTPIAQPGDITLDCIVGPADLAQLLSQWGQCPPTGTCPADISPAKGDGLVGPADLAALLANWG